MRGFAIDVNTGVPPPPFDAQVVGLVVSKDFPDPAVIRDALRRGLKADPETVFVVRDSDAEAIAAVEDVGSESVLLPLNPHWKYTIPARYDVKVGPSGRAVGAIKIANSRAVDARSSMREQEILHSCNVVLVFTTPTTKTLDAFKPKSWHKHVHVIMRGAQPVKKHRKGRKPIGV